MQQYLISFLIFTPLLAALLALFVPRSRDEIFRILTLVVSVIQGLVLVVMFTGYSGSGLNFVEQKPWISLALGNWGAMKAEYFVAVDGLSFPLVALSVFIMFIATISSWSIRENVKGYFILLLILNAAIIGTFTALDFLLFYLCFEFMLLPMFFLIAIWGGKRREYASMKFFLYTLLGSILILIVLIGLYMSVHAPGDQLTVHSLNLIHMTDPANYVSQSILDPAQPWLLWKFDARQWGFLLLFVGFAIKLPAVPLHTWLPDAHVEAPTPISVVLAALLLKIGGYGLLRIAYPIFPEAAMYFSSFVAIVGIISIVYGALNAMASKDLKRLIAYSSVSHMGFVLLGLSSLTSEGVAGAMYQMVSHGIITAMLFIIVGVLYDRTHDRTIGHYSGLSQKMKTFTAFVLVGFFASMGLPGFSGFIAEILVFLGAFRAPSANGLLHESFAIIATSGLIFSAAYYLWTLQRMFFGPFDLKAGLRAETLTPLTRAEYMVLVPLAVLTLVLGIMPQPLLNYIDPFAQQFTELVLSSGKRLTLTP